MKNNLLTARDIHGPYMQLLTNLQGENGQKWLTALNRFLKKEDAWGKTDTNTTHLRFLHLTALAPTTGATTLAIANGVFTGYLDPNFQDWGTNVYGVDTAETQVNIYEIKKSGTFAELFGSLSDDPRSLCLSQGQIRKFCRTHRPLFRQDDSFHFFLFEVNGELFVALARVGGGELKAYVIRFSSSHVWYAAYCHRVVVPQQTL